MPILASRDFLHYTTYSTPNYGHGFLHIFEFMYTLKYHFIKSLHISLFTNY